MQTEMTGTPHPKKVPPADYIIAHGIYSWVPGDVRDKLMAICHDNLSPNGIAYVSYNVFPGWHMLGALRNMMRYHIRDIVRPTRTRHPARQFVDFLLESPRLMILTARWAILFMNCCKVITALSPKNEGCLKGMPNCCCTMSWRLSTMPFTSMNSSTTLNNMACNT